ncbi:MAG: methyltransferase [Thomasclavelia sp.]|nr:methyltransferase [Thomasclavelia sp.]
MKYLYVFNYPEFEYDLCKLEFKSIFHEEMKSKYFLTNIKIDINISAYIKERIDIYYFNTNFKELLEDVIESNLDYEDFKIVHYKNDTHHLDYKDSLNKAQSLSYGIGGSVNMNHPKVTLAYTNINGLWVFGKLHHGTDSWKKFENKPHSFSNSLNIKLARTLVNIAYEGNHNLKGIDPCCGMGTVVLEALALNYQMVGSDRSREISYKARLNLEHYNFDGLLITRSNIEDITSSYDVCIIDLPYNLYTKITPEQQLSIIKSSRKITKKLVLVTYEEMDEDIINSNYVIIDKVKVSKNQTETFSRYIYVCR